MRNRIIITMVGLIVVVGYATLLPGSAQSSSSHSGINGVVMAVAVRPHHGKIEQATTAIGDASVTIKQNPAVVGRATTGSHGHFRVTVRPGSYRIIVRSSRSNLPCEVHRLVIVRAGKFTKIKIYCSFKVH